MSPRKKFKLIPYAPPCPACGTPMLSVGSRFHGGWWCPEERKAVSDPTPQAAQRKCSLGIAWVVPYLAVLDQRPDLLASGLPFWTDEEWQALAAMPPAERQVAWNRRATATIKERQDRAADPKRRVDRGTKPAQEEA